MFPIRALQMRNAALSVPGLDQYVSADGANQPFLGTATYPAAIYDGDKTWIAWESWSGTARIPEAAGYNAATGYWTDIEATGVTPLTDDDHGPPALCVDDEGHLHCFYGNHNTDQLHSSTQWDVSGTAGAGSLWAIRSPITGEYAYPHPVVIGTDIYLLLRKYISASTKYTLVLRKTATLVAGVATWNSEVSLVDFGASTRFYMGTVEPNGTDIWIVATKADLSDTLRENVYLFVYDTVTGAVKNHDGSSSVASGSLPVDLATADANFKLFDHAGSNDEGGAPAFCFDTNGDPHVIFKDGAGTAYDVKHIVRSGGSWASPVSIGTVDSRFNCPILVPLSGARVEAWYAVDPLAAFDRFGHIAKRERSSGGTWGAETTVLSAVNDGLGNPSAVRGGIANARVIFSEAINDATDASAGGLKAFLYGDGGLIAYEQEPEAATTPDTLQLNADNLQLNGEDLTLGV